MVGTWKLLNTSTTGTGTTTISSGTFTASDYLRIIIYYHGIGEANPQVRFNNDSSSSNYYNTYRVSNSSNSTGNTQSSKFISYSANGTPQGFMQIQVMNLDNEEKLVTASNCEKPDTNASSAPNYIQWVGKYTVKSGQVTEVSLTSNGGNFGSESYISVYGASDDVITDEKDTLTNVPAGTRYEDYTARKIYRAKSVGFPNGTSGSGSDWTEVAFDSSTSANNGTASGNVVTRSSYPSSGDWTSYIRSSTHYLDPSEGGGEVYFTVSNNSHVSMGLEKSPYNEYPSGVYQSRDYSFHTTTATNNMYEKTSSYDGTDWNNATNEWRITMDSEGEVKYYYRENSSSSWGDPERTSNVVASGKYYVSVSVYSTSSCTCYIKSDASMAWVERGNA